jgi:hypothetical protein
VLNIETKQPKLIVQLLLRAWPWPHVNAEQVRLRQGYQKIKVKNNKNSGLSWVCRCFWERERAGEEEISEGPGGALSHQGGAARARPRHLCVRWHGSPSWCLAGVSLPHFWHKNL